MIRRLSKLFSFIVYIITLIKSSACIIYCILTLEAHLF